MSPRARRVVAAIALWLAVVASTSTAAWVMIDRAGRGAYLTEGAGSGVSVESVTPTTATTPPATTSPSGGHPASSTRAGTTPTPVPSPTTQTPGSTGRSTPTHPASASTSPAAPQVPTSVDDTVSVAGGSVGATCRGTTLTLRFVTPANGWAYHLDRSPESIEVAFRQTAGQGESEVHVQCSHGVPVFETNSSDEGRDEERP